MILLHDFVSGAQVYSLDQFQQLGIGDADVKLAGHPFPVHFVSGSPFAILGATGM
jgi:hypothetical protein